MGNNIKIKNFPQSLKTTRKRRPAKKNNWEDVEFCSVITAFDPLEISAKLSAEFKRLEILNSVKIIYHTGGKNRADEMVEQLLKIVDY